MQEQPIGNVWWRTSPESGQIFRQDYPTGTLPVYGSPSFVNTFYVSHSGFRGVEIIPHVHRSSDNGQHGWISPPIYHKYLQICPYCPGIPTAFCRQPMVEYIFTLNSGSSWTRLGANMPYVLQAEVEENPVLNHPLAGPHLKGDGPFPLDSPVYTRRKPWNYYGIRYV
ncbi:MAG: hypothetical protein R2792_00830 [Saprospiraceae bacterium]